MLGGFNHVFSEDEVPLIRFVRQYEPFDGFFQFLFRLHLTLTSIVKWEAGLRQRLPYTLYSVPESL